MNRRKTQDARRKTIQWSRLIFVCCALVSCALTAVAQQQSAKRPPTPAVERVPRPKLIVGIVVDQMRYDFLYRYYERYSEDGFKKLLKGGFSCEQTHYNYMPTYTGPGHASIYTGTTPAVHGIIANNWFDKKSGKMVYCAGDDSASGVGTTSAAGKMSPRRMVGTSVADQLQLATNQQSKVIGIALKDRGAILPAGHMADAAYWFDDATPNWISSSFYMKELPQWVKTFNAEERPKTYLSIPWNTLYPLETYVQSAGDTNAYERPLPTETTTTFPHNLPSIFEKTNSYAVLRTTPFGNSLTTNFAIAALTGERMGADSITDFLCLSYSSTDYVGHSFGPNSVETEDTYLRLDREIGRLMKYIKKTIGLENVLIFLTADHGVAEIPDYMESLRVKSTVVDEKAMEAKVKSFCHQGFGDSLVASFYNQQFFFSDVAIAKLKLNRDDVAEKVAAFVRTLDDGYQVYTANDLLRNEYNRLPASAVQLGFHPQRSGDVMVNYPPHRIDFGNPGTTHGSPYAYDTHVPLLWYGWNVKPGKTFESVNITDIAPTISAMLRMMEPSGTTGKVILPLLEK